MNPSAGIRTLTIGILSFATLLGRAQVAPSPLGGPERQGVQGGEAQPAGEAFTVQLHGREVLIPLVVRDAQGRAIGDLKQEDFKVFDQGKPRKIAGFSVERAAAAEQAALPTTEKSSTNAPSAAPSVTAPKQFIVFLFDDRHLGVADEEEVKKAGTGLLNAPLADGDRGVVLSFLGVNSGMTHDHAVLQAAVMKLKPQTAFHPGQHQCPDIDYYSADQILNKHNNSEFQIYIEKAANCTHSKNTDALEQLVRSNATLSLETGDQDVRETLTYLRDVVHTLSKLPGQKTVILVSPGFLSSSDEALNLQSQILDLAAGSHVTISALDAAGLSSSSVPASEGGSGSVFGDITGQSLGNRLEAMREAEDIMAKLADGTGGTFFRHSNDLQGGLRDLASGPEFTYLVEISLQDVKPDGAYHALKVQLDRKDLKLQARQGYFAPLPSKAGR